MTKVKETEDVKKFNQIAKDLKKISKSNDWIDKYQPQNIDDIIFPVKYKKMVHKWLELGYDEEKDLNILNLPNLNFCSSSGKGKTLMSSIITKTLGIKPLFINASLDNGIDVIRNQIKVYTDTKSIINEFTNRLDKKIVILDEFDNTSQEFQKSFRSFIETYKSSVRFIITMNYEEKVIDPILARFNLGYLNFDRIYSENKKEMITQLYKHCIKIVESEGVEYKKEVIQTIISNSYPDIRSTIALLQHEYILNGNLLNKIKSIDTKFLIDTIKKGDIQKLHQISKDNFMSNKIFTDLRNYFVSTNNILALVAIAKKSEVLNFSIDKTISILDLLLDLHDIIGEIK